MFDKKTILEQVCIKEAKAAYEIYHPTYTSAVDAAIAYAKQQGYDTNEDDLAFIIGNGPRKPSNGATVKPRPIPLYKNGKLVKKTLNISVYNRDSEKNPYELTAYVS